MTASVSKRKIKALAGWSGSGRMVAEHVGIALQGCKWVGVPFAGGMSELLYIDAGSILVSDLHRHIINLAQQVKRNRSGIQAECDALAVHPDELRDAQYFCSAVEADKFADGDDMRFRWAVNYFTCCWMGHGGRAGTEKEFDGGLSFRWDAGGGDSAKRFRSATESLEAWDDIMPRCTFVCLDAFEFLKEAKKRDLRGHGLYIDAPWPDDGDNYLHKFTEQQHRLLAEVLGSFQYARIVIRYADHPLIRGLYPESRWIWHKVVGRTQANKEKAEVLIVSRREALP